MLLCLERHWSVGPVSLVYVDRSLKHITQLTADNFISLWVFLKGLNI